MEQHTLKELLLADVATLCQSASWCLSHKDEAKIVAMLGKYMAGKAMGMCLSQPTCDRCSKCLKLVGLNVRDVRLKDVCNTALGCAYTEAMHNPLRAMHVLQEIVDGVKDLSKLPHETADGRHEAFIEAVIRHPHNAMGELMKVAHNIYDQKHEQAWIKYELPNALKTIYSVPASAGKALLQRLYFEGKAAGGQHADMAEDISARLGVALSPSPSSSRPLPSPSSSRPPRRHDTPAPRGHDTPAPRRHDTPAPRGHDTPKRAVPDSSASA